MKLSKARLRQIIKEEVDSMQTLVPGTVRDDASPDQVEVSMVNALRMMASNLPELTIGDLEKDENLSRAVRTLYKSLKDRGALPAGRREEPAFVAMLNGILGSGRAIGGHK
tara:strand:- start:365 stop:697 length:333 start_codon:yes stop_codon:yes gene_type:complete